MLQKHGQQDSGGLTGVAIIGAGERGVYFLGTRMAELAEETGFRVIGVFDVLPDRARYAAEHLSKIYAGRNIDHRVAVFDDLQSATEAGAVDLVLVTSHTDAHRLPVEAALRAGKRVYLDKPIAVSLADGEAIVEAEKTAGQPILMGFTRRYERPWIESVRLAHGGAIGSPQMILLRSVIPYSRYLQLWHRTNAKSGGALNDKCSHHFDVLNWIADAEPVSVSAIGGRSGVFAPDAGAPERCSVCDRACPYRRHETLVDKFEGVGEAADPSWAGATRIEDRNDTCVYLPGSDIDDHAIVTIKYANDMSACLFFTIFGPWAKDQETLEIVGSSGRLRMVRHTGEIDLIADHGHRNEKVSFADPDRSSTHFGADLELVRSLKRFCGGEVPPVGVREGLKSLRIVQAAQASLRQNGAPVDPATLVAP